MGHGVVVVVGGGRVNGAGEGGGRGRAERKAFKAAAAAGLAAADLQGVVVVWRWWLGRMPKAW